MREKQHNGEKATQVRRIVSGGQTGVDRAALDAALDLGYEVGGWCPAGRRAEDGCVPTRYPLRETPSAEYAERTSWNVRDGDATLVLVRGEPAGGTLLTIEEARRCGTPLLVLRLGELEPEAVVTWLEKNKVEVLNVAGPRESEEPGVYREAHESMRTVLLAASQRP